MLQLAKAGRRGLHHCLTTGVDLRARVFVRQQPEDDTERSMQTSECTYFKGGTKLGQVTQEFLEHFIGCIWRNTTLG